MKLERTCHWQPRVDFMNERNVVRSCTVDDVVSVKHALHHFGFTELAGFP